jgi:hypothetical protein
VRYNRIREHTYINNLISLSGFVFRESSNTEMGMYTLTNPILEMLERRNHVVGNLGFDKGI